MMKNVKSLIAALLFISLAISFAANAQTKDGPVEKCLIISDIHFDPMYGAKCDTAFRHKLEKSSPADWQKYFEKSGPAMTLDPSMLGQDANYAVLKSALINMQRTLPHPAFIIIAGDFIWHNATPADLVLKQKSIAFIAWLFQNTFGNVPILPAMGNNDTYGDDYKLQTPQFLNDFADAWLPNLPEAANELKVHQGAYTYKHGNLTLMVVNSASLHFDTRSDYQYPAQADTLLKWVETNLADPANKNVWIISHIPPGYNVYKDQPQKLWDTGYTTRFVNSVVTNAPKVKFSIASHTHLNDFKVFYNHNKKPVAFMRIVPSICSNHLNNPSFEVAEFDSTTGSVISETNHFVNLAVLPVGNSNLAVTWAGKLKTTELLGGKVTAKSFSGLIDKVKNDKTGAKRSQYIRFYNVGTHIDTSKTINRHNYTDYLKVDSLKAK
jgi:hypothetical protein